MNTIITARTLFPTRTSVTTPIRTSRTRHIIRTTPTIGISHTTHVSRVGMQRTRSTRGARGTHCTLGTRGTQSREVRVIRLVCVHFVQRVLSIPHVTTHE